MLHVGSPGRNFNDMVVVASCCCSPSTPRFTKHTAWAYSRWAVTSSLFWLHGIAGVGKSLLAQPLSEKWDSFGLAFSFLQVTQRGIRGAA